MSVRPRLLGVYEKYFLPLGKDLAPTLHGFVLGLLPGLEDESEHTERYVCVCIHTYIHIISVCVYVYVFVCVHACMCACVFLKFLVEMEILGKEVVISYIFFRSFLIPKNRFFSHKKKTLTDTKL